MESILSQEASKLILNPSFQAADTILHITGGTLGMAGLIDELENQVQELESGDASTIKRTLYSQLITLDKLFHDLCKCGLDDAKAARYRAPHFLHVALKCQRQSMQTAALLSAYLPPPPVRGEQSSNELLTMESKSDG